MKIYNITTQGNLNLLLTEEELFRALSRKAEEPKPECNCTKMFNGTIADTSDCKIHATDVGLKEPKSTLREAIRQIILTVMFSKPEYLDINGDKPTDQIISLFKDTLLKEIAAKQAEKHIQRDSELLQTFTNTKIEITNLIKNL